MTGRDNIFPSGGPEEGTGPKLSDEQVQAYLEGRLSPEEQRKVELWLAEEGMERDALEGLLGTDMAETMQRVGRLRYRLQSQVRSGKRRKGTIIKGQTWTLVAVFLVLLLAIIAFLLLRTLTGS